MRCTRFFADPVAPSDVIYSPESRDFTNISSSLTTVDISFLKARLFQYFSEFDGDVVVGLAAAAGEEEDSVVVDTAGTAAGVVRIGCTLA